MATFVTFSMTLSDPEPGFQGQCILRSRISQKRCVLGTKLLKNTNLLVCLIHEDIGWHFELHALQRYGATHATGRLLATCSTAGTHQRSVSAVTTPRSPALASHATAMLQRMVRLLIGYYAALLPRRGPHIASHSVCPSVCPSVPLSLPSVTSFRQPLASRMYFSARTQGIRTFRHALRLRASVLFCTH